MESLYSTTYISTIDPIKFNAPINTSMYVFYDALKQYVNHKNGPFEKCMQTPEVFNDLMDIYIRYVDKGPAYDTKANQEIISVLCEHNLLIEIQPR